jgi:hypothetical protein
MSDELSGFEQSIGPKRKRTSTVSLACSNCRKKHVKCDGKQPCTRCKVNNQECSFEQSEKKRGPVVGKLASVRKGLSSLKDELAKQKELAEEWERKYKALTASREGLQLMNLSKHAKTNALLAMSYTFNDYVNKYYAYAFPFFKVAPPIQHVDQFAQNQDPAKMSCMYAMLGTVAMTVGNTGQVREFISTAKALVTPIYDSMDPFVATTHTILSRVFLLVGDYERSNFYNAMAMTIANNLLARRESQVVRGVDLLHISRLATMWSLRVDNEFEKQLALFDEVINDMSHTLKDATAGSNMGFDVLPFYAVMLISKVWAEGYLLFVTKQKPDPNMLQRWLSTLDHAHNSVLQSTLASWSKKLFVVAIEAVKAWIYLFSGHHEAALQICDVVMSMLDSEMSNLIFAIPSIVMVASIYLFLRQHDKFSQSIQALQLFTEKHVLAAMIMKALNDFKQFDLAQKPLGALPPPDLGSFMAKFGEFLVTEGSKYRLLMPEITEEGLNPITNNSNLSLQAPSPPSTLVIENLPSPSQFSNPDLDDLDQSNNPSSPSMAFYSYPNQGSYNNAMHAHHSPSSSHSDSSSNSPIHHSGSVPPLVFSSNMNHNNNMQRGPNSAVISMMQNPPMNNNTNTNFPMVPSPSQGLERYGLNNGMPQQYNVPSEFYDSNSNYEVVADEAQAHMNNVLGMASTISEMKLPKFTYL